jgi:hypothetical protein
VIAGFTVFVDDANPYHAELAVGTSISMMANGISVPFLTWVMNTGTIPPGASLTDNPLSLTLTEKYNITAKFGLPVRYYYITATSDSGSTVSPSGKTTVLRGSDQTFTFSANSGYIITSVTIDGVPLTQAQIDLGSYTFTNVIANHFIDVYTTNNFITLTVKIVEGSGSVDYSLNGRTTTEYTTVVPMPSPSTVSLYAYAASGYTFAEWDTSTTKYTDPEVSFNNWTSSIYIEVHFVSGNSSGGGGPGGGSGGGSGGSPGHGFDWWWLILIIAAILLFALLLWFLLFYRRYYDVIKIEHPSVTVIGDDRVHRKSEYRFRIEGTFSGTISYRIGEDGQWKTLFPGTNGEYVIPKGEITDDVMIEIR